MKIFNREIFFRKRKTQIVGKEAFYIRVFFVAIGFVGLGFIFFLNGVNPLELFLLSDRSMPRVILILLPNAFVTFIPLLCIAVGLAVPFKARVDNIGAEGQFVMGMLAAYWVATEFSSKMSALTLIPLMFIAGFIIGAIWALPVVIFRAKGGFQGADVVVSFLMVFPALYLMEYLVSGPWKDPLTGFALSEKIPDNSLIPTLDFELYVPILDTTWNFSPVAISIFLVLIISVLAYYFLFRTVNGVPKTKLAYEINITGKNPLAARLAGISFFKVIFISMVISGGLAGIAGVSHLAGSQERLTVYSPGFGFTAIAVAYLGGLNPLGIIFSALLFAALFIGGVAINLTGLPVSTLDMFTGVILLAVLLSEFFFRYTIIWRHDQ